MKKNEIRNLIQNTVKSMWGLTQEAWEIAYDALAKLENDLVDAGLITWSEIIEAEEATC